MAIKFAKKRICFLISIISFFLSSATVWFIPFVSFEGEAWQKTMAYILGALFWLGLAAGITFLLLVNRMRKKEAYKKTIPFIWFFRNGIAVIFDVALIASFIGLFFILFVKGLNQWLLAGILFAFIFSLEMHGMFNGENYKFVSNQKRLQREQEGK